MDSFSSSPCIQTVHENNNRRRVFNTNICTSYPIRPVYIRTTSLVDLPPFGRSTTGQSIHLSGGHLCFPTRAGFRRSLALARSRQFDAEFAFEFGNDLWIRNGASGFVVSHYLGLFVNRRGEFFLRQLFRCSGLQE